MSLDDVRLQWLRDRVLAALGLTDPAPFEDLLNRGGGQEARTVLSFFERDRDTESEAGTALLLLRAERRSQDGEEAPGEAPAALAC